MARASRRSAEQASAARLLDLPLARRIALAAAGLGGAAPPPTDGGAPAPAGAGDDGPERVADATAAMIERLGSVQIDTISVVERAHHHVLLSRVPGYRPGILPLLEAAPRRVIEYWSHAAAYIPLGDWRFCLPRMERVRAQGHEWFRADPAVVARVRERLRAEGPLRSGDWAHEAEGPRGWWNWKPAKVALEYLFHAGEVVSMTRQGFQKVYDLAERVLPPSLGLSMPTAGEMAAWYVDRAVSALGVFAAADVAYMRKDLVGGIEDEIAHRVEDGRLLACSFPEDGLPGGRERRHYLEPGLLAAAAAAPRAGACRAWLLSPFDPLLIDRRRARRLFGVEYQVECYVPEAKRRFGYFALPILLVDEAGEASFAGLADTRMERDRGVYRVLRLALWRERPPRGAGRAGAEARASIAAAVAEAIAAYGTRIGASALELGRVETADPALETALRGRVGPAMRQALRALAGQRPAGAAATRGPQAKKRRTRSFE